MSTRSEDSKTCHDNRGVAVGHYENFPVASWLCPAPLRPAVAAIYHFARTADDLADEGDVAPADRLAALAAYRQELHRTVAGQPGLQTWRWVFGPLGDAIRRHALPIQPFEALLDAFVQDVNNPPYPDRHALLRYCERSANPVGRLLLHLYGIHDPRARAMSDDVCSALQLINFWQDLGVDLRRNRNYLPTEDLMQHGVHAAAVPPEPLPQPWRDLVRSLCTWARTLMLSGAPLALAVPGRAGWELRGVVQGGLRILDKIEANGWDCLHHRPRLRATDVPLLAWRCWRTPLGARP